MQFDHSEYWEDRYRLNSGEYEWYLSYSSIEQLIQQHVSKDSEILHVGVGTSTMHEEMALSGYQSITNVDYSKKCIEVIEDRWQSRSDPRTARFSHMTDICSSTLDKNLRPCTRGSLGSEVWPLVSPFRPVDSL